MNYSFSMSFHKISFWLIIISVLAACQSTGPFQAYEGPKKSAHDVATFIVPHQYTLLSIDGVKFKTVMLKDGATIKLLPGSHQFLIEYFDFIDLGGNDFEKVRSKPIAITFKAEAGSQYSVNSVRPEDVEKAQKFAEKPSISIVDTKNKQTMSAEIKYNLYSGELFTTLFIGEKSESASISAATPTNASHNKKTVNNGQASEMLRYWWETANKEQQDDFRQWLENH